MSNQEEPSSSRPLTSPQPAKSEPATFHPTAAQDASSEPWVHFHPSPHFVEWMGQEKISLAFTTYQAGKFFLLGTTATGQLARHERTFARCMGLFAVNDQTIWMSSLYQIWRFENALPPGASYEGCDRLYVPHVGHTTSALDIHDLAVESSGRVVFANTRFNCLATLSQRDSFAPLWRPPFISKLVAEDRCHLNGVALVDGRARYVTAVGISDVFDGWREHRTDGGAVIDSATNQVIASGLSMPHSPRFYRDRLWLLNSGTGFFGSLDPASGKFEPLAFCPGYMRGLAFVGDYAIIGLSRPRHDQTFFGLPLDDELRNRGEESRCGLIVIELSSGDVAHTLRIEGHVQELYDVAVLPNVRRPTALGLKTDEIHRVCTVGAAVNPFSP